MTAAVGYLDVSPKLASEHRHPEGYGREKCRGYWTWRMCFCEDKPVYLGGCGRRNCSKCGPGRTGRQAARVLDRFVAGGANRVQALVLTVPPSHRPQYAGKAGGKRWALAVRRFFAWLRKECGVKYGYERSHPCGDDGKTFAPHANLLFVQSSGKRGRLDVAEFRRVWAEIVGGKELLDQETGAGKVDLQLMFYTLHETAGRFGIGGFVHKLQYIERPFPGWMWAGARSRWLGDFPFRGEKVPRSMSSENVCPTCHQEYRMVRMSPGDAAATEAEFRAGTLRGFCDRRHGVFRES